MPLFFERVNNFILKFCDPYGLRESPTFTNRWSGSPSAPSSYAIRTNPATDAIHNPSNTLQGRDYCPPELPAPPPCNQPSQPVAYSSMDQFGAAASSSGVFQGTAKPPAEHLSSPDEATPHGLLEGGISPSISPSPSIPIIHASQGILEGAKDFKIENSVLTNIQGNATIFRFDSGSPPSEEFKSVLVGHMAGFITVRDFDKIEKRTLSQAIRDLPRAEAAYDDYVSGDRRRVACFEGTRQVLLEEIAQCVASAEGARAYLLFGIAGIGKSTVAQTISKRADNLRILGASFFFSRDEADRRNAKKFFTTIAFQLCAYDADFAQAIGTALTNERGAAATSKEPQRQLEALILEPLQATSMSRSLPTLIVVDALDECDAEDGPRVLLALDQLVRELPFFKVVLTTRPQPHLQDPLDFLGTHQTFRMEDIERKVAESDIRRYLEYRVRARLPRLRRMWATNEEELNSLVRAAGVLFIIASTAVLYILDKAACNPGSRMKALQDELAQNRTPFNTLNDFYTVILRSAVPLGCERDIVERYQAVIGTIVLIKDPLPVSALANLIGLAEEDIFYVLDNLQSVISLGNNSVPLVYHKSFPDYITDDQRCQDTNLCITPKDHHTRLATRCLRVMNRHLKRNIFGLSGPVQYLDNDEALKEEKLSKDDVERAVPSELQYACVHWTGHVAGADPEDGRLAAEFKTFVEVHLLHWLEALSWTHKFDTASLSLAVVLKLQIAGLDIRQIFYDALRLVSRDYEKIERSALDIYHSAIPFTPNESLLYKNYQHEALLCQVIGGPTQWDIQIAEHQHGKYVDQIQFAKDGSRFASWSADTVKLWDATSGTPIGTLYGEIIVVAGDFSVFAGAKGHLATIHAVSSCAPITSFNHPAEIVKMSISFDGFRLAAGLKSGIVRIWDVATKASVADLDGYNLDGYNDGSAHGSCRVAFSPSGYMLAFTSKGGISLWNEGVGVARLQHEARKPVKFAFSGDSTRLATLAEKDEVHTLRLWNSNSGEFIAIAVDVGERLAISADGLLVATGRGKKEVQLWSGDSLALVDTIPITKIGSLAFSGDILAITAWEDDVVILYSIENRASIAELELCEPICLAFSPDGTRLAAGYLHDFIGPPNDTLRLWDVSRIRKSTLTSDQQSSPVTALSFSPDCSRLASGRDDGCVELWDTGHMEQPIAFHKLHSGPINALAFSPDGDQLASGSEDKMVRFWDGRGGTHIGVLEHSFPDSLTALAFSSSLLAAATTNIITLWDRTSLHLIYTLEKGGDLLSFSLDGSMLAAHYRNSHRSEVAMLDTENLLEMVDTEEGSIEPSIFAFSKHITALFLSPDGSKVAIQHRTQGLSFIDTGFCFFDFVNMAVITNLENEDFNWIPHLNGVPILWSRDCLSGWFSARHDCVPVLNIPRNFRVRKFASGSAMFALGCDDGRILLIQPPANY